MNRKLALILAAIVLPGGFIALLGAMFLRALGQTERGRKVFALARKRVPRWRRIAPTFQERQVA
ncbi:MAG: hypothetical protein E6J84_01685 [Deltaproteobacteria bacterium]|nr:MAG: hypothetical protein E6J84_01685 [Deltaproteobacteria bacterium]